MKIELCKFKEFVLVWTPSSPGATSTKTPYSFTSLISTSLQQGHQSSLSQSKTVSTHLYPSLGTLLAGWKARLLYLPTYRPRCRPLEGGPFDGSTVTLPGTIAVQKRAAELELLGIHLPNNSILSE